MDIDKFQMFINIILKEILKHLSIMIKQIIQNYISMNPFDIFDMQKYLFKIAKFQTLFLDKLIY